MVCPAGRQCRHRVAAEGGKDMVNVGLPRGKSHANDGGVNAPLLPVHQGGVLRPGHFLQIASYVEGDRLVKQGR